MQLKRLTTSILALAALSTVMAQEVTTLVKGNCSAATKWVYYRDWAKRNVKEDSVATKNGTLSVRLQKGGKSGAGCSDKATGTTGAYSILVYSWCSRQGTAQAYV